MGGPTPGPWIADTHHTQDYAGRTHGFIRAPGQLVPLAAVVLGVEGMPQDEGRANLAAMVAAYELIRDGSEAADFLLSTFGGVSDPSNEALWSDSEAYTVYWNLRGAISKATGEA